MSLFLGNAVCLPFTQPFTTFTAVTAPHGKGLRTDMPPSMGHCVPVYGAISFDMSPFVGGHVPFLGRIFGICPLGGGGPLFVPARVA